MTCIAASAALQGGRLCLRGCTAWHVNHCLRHIERRKGDNLPLDEQVLPDADWHSDPQRVYSKQELSDQLQNALHQLSPGHANVVVLCELHGLSYQECAQILTYPGRHGEKRACSRRFAGVCATC